MLITERRTMSLPSRTGDSLRLLWQLVSGRFSGRDYLNEPKNRLKLALRSLLTLPWTLQWLAYIQQQPELLAYLATAPRLVAKLHRPYLHRQLGMSDKLAALRYHYRAMLALPPPQRQILLTGERLCLATVHGRHDSRFHCLLSHQHSFDKEGELMLRWLNADQTTLACLTFTLCEIAGQRSIVIGGLQGAPRHVDHALIKQATKACHGLFPKRLLIEALQALGTVWQIRQVLAVATRHHIYRSWRYRRVFAADYDHFWQSLNARRINAALYALPCPLLRKTADSIASHKRSEYQRRYALLDALSAQIQLALR